MSSKSSGAAEVSDGRGAGGQGDSSTDGLRFRGGETICEYDIRAPVTRRIDTVCCKVTVANNDR